MNFLKDVKQQKNANRTYLRNDIIFIVALLLLVGVGVLYLFVFRSAGDTVRVTVDGELYGIYPLSQNTVQDIRTGENQSNSNRLVILDGKAYMEYADCPDGICVAHRPIFRDGESIVCLPNRVVVTVITDGDDDSPDIIS